MGPHEMFTEGMKLFMGRWVAFESLQEVLKFSWVAFEILQKVSKCLDLWVAFVVFIERFGKYAGFYGQL